MFDATFAPPAECVLDAAFSCADCLKALGAEPLKCGNLEEKFPLSPILVGSITTFAGQSVSGTQTLDDLSQTLRNLSVEKYVLRCGG